MLSRQRTFSIHYQDTRCYLLKYQDTHLTFNDRDELFNRDHFTVESNQIDKKEFENAIQEGFKEFRDFVVKNKLPISSYQFEQLFKQKLGI